MKLNINNKEFEGKYNKKGELIISLLEDADKLFFIDWFDLSVSGLHKYQYVKDIEFEKFHHYGTLKNCFPILNHNENEVKISYDYYTLK